MPNSIIFFTGKSMQYFHMCSHSVVRIGDLGNLLLCVKQAACFSPAKYCTWIVWHCCSTLWTVLALYLSSMECTNWVLMLVCRRFSVMYWKRESLFKPASREICVCQCWLFCLEGKSGGRIGCQECGWQSTLGSTEVATGVTRLILCIREQTSAAVGHCFEQWLRKLLIDIAVIRLEDKDPVLYQQ